MASPPPSVPPRPSQESRSEVRRCVRDKLRRGVYRLSRGHRGGRRSAVWQHFGKVQDQRGASVGYAGCFHCLDVLRHKSHMSGTSSLFSHLRSCPVHATHSTHGILPPPPMPLEVSEVSVKEEVMEDDLLHQHHQQHQQQHHQQEQQDPSLLEACVDCITSDLVPPHVLRGAGFLRLAQVLVDCGARHGATHALALLPSQTQLQARVAALATEERQRLGAELRGEAGRGAALVVSASPLGHHVLLLRSLHDWRLNTRLLGLCPAPTPDQEPPPAHQEPRKAVTHILKKFDVCEAWEKEVPLVTCGEMPGWGGAVVPCVSHMLGQAVTHLLHNATQPPLHQLRDYLHQYRGLVRWAATTQSTELTAHLTTDEGDLRAWRCTLAMVKSVGGVRGELRRAEPPLEMRHALRDTAAALLEDFTDVLAPVRAATEDLEALGGATLHKVVPWLLHLRNSCTALAEDSDGRAALKAALLEGLHAHATPAAHHRLAVFFNPRMSSLKVLSQEEREEVRREVLALADPHHDHAPHHHAPHDAPQESTPQGPLAYLEDTPQDSLTAHREMEVYAIAGHDAHPDTLLPWWQRNAPLLPLLAAAAARVLAIPASTTTTPALHTPADTLLRPSPPEPHVADDLVFLHSRFAHTS